jgi:molybdate transport system substrate-binding protein
MLTYARSSHFLAFARAACVAMVALAGLALSASSCGDSPRSSSDRDVLILAAASTIDALGSAIADFTASTGIEVRASYGPTSTLARQVTAGAPASLLLSASTYWAEYVAERQPVAARRSIAGNRLVVVASTSSAPAKTLDLAALAVDSRFGRIAIADPEAVPAGIYAQEALENLGFWISIEPRLLPTLDVRAALALAASEEADAAIVYASDAAASDAVEIIATIDTSAHSSIEYPLLLLNEDSREAAALFEFLVSDEGRRHFLNRGFSALSAGGS